MKVADDVERCATIAMPLLPGQEELQDGPNASVADRAFREHFAKACLRIWREPDIEFGDGLLTYGCDAHVDGPPTVDFARDAALATALRDFGPAVYRSYGVPIAAHGKDALLILTDSSGKVIDVVSDLKQIQRVKAIKTLRGAVDFLALTEIKGYDELIDLCQSNATISGGGWLFSSIPQNCAPYERDIFVSRSGRLSVSRRHVDRISCRLT